ncbi:lipoprotein [Bradyrhizobium sp. LHD-71]|nr:lipoprotein [Bradyrhizobium sp. LHD-71]MDQ8730587.1 lipoprotein [Bradyrhizobium sp. LHD-71]
MFHQSRRFGSGRLALIGAALLALALGGCGRKGPLDLPPQAAAQPAPGAPAQAQPARSNPFGLFDPVEEEQPSVPPSRKGRIFLDNILD